MLETVLIWKKNHHRVKIAEKKLLRLQDERGEQNINDITDYSNIIIANYYPWYLAISGSARAS